MTGKREHLASLVVAPDILPTRRLSQRSLDDPAPRQEFWYRASGQTYAAMPDEWGESRGVGRTDVHITQYQVLKRTAKGVWLYNFGDRKFVLASARKQFASPTEAAAWESLIHRKKRQITILTNQLETAKLIMHLAEAAAGGSKQKEASK